MAQPVHTYGPTCGLHEPDAEDATQPTDDLNPPKVRAQFFYVSALPIDDPLSPLPPIYDSKSSPTKPPPQPFSVRDNNALEEAWQDVRLKRDSRPPSSGAELVASSPRIISDPPRHGGKDGEVAQAELADVLSSHSLLSDTTQGPSNLVMLTKASGLGEDANVTTHRAKSNDNSAVSAAIKIKDVRQHSISRENSPYPRNSVGSRSIEVSGSVDLHTSGRPFARVPSRGFPQPHGSLNALDDDLSDSNTRDTDAAILFSHNSAQGRTRPTGSRSRSRGKTSNREGPGGTMLYVPVGIARLHLVELPEMTMKPIYWSPVNDISRVIRATWFYKSTMSPVEPDVANRLELGYEDMKPWTNAWQDELNSCVEYGAEAEAKIARRLWPEDDKTRPNRPGTSLDTKSNVGDVSQCQDDLISEIPEHPENTAAAPASMSRPTRMFANHSVIYVDARNAQILRPSLAPSASRHRTPLHGIRKGREIGIPVVRGFDRKAWDKRNPPAKMDAQTANAKVGAFLSSSGDAATRSRRPSCSACCMHEKKQPVSDLVLVIHGIGQKLSEKQESFHFTHAINSFRREVNMQLVSEAVRGNLRGNMGGIMVLPVNWRLTVDLSGEERPSTKKCNQFDNEFSLNDITPTTLPAIRSLISDVMLDIPYYLSQHKDKMVSAVIKEANRVYRLWCRNNPGFHEYGRVHLIAHSLGSAMSLDILSKQPTKLPRSIDLNAGINERNFEFDTKSLFCCGSPAGFFLLLNRASLIPRRGRQKRGFEGEDEGPGIAGDVGQYGCLAVDNVYNVMHYNDPIAYHMNAAVDVEYANMLQPANIPSAQPGWFESWTNRPGKKSYFTPPKSSSILGATGGSSGSGITRPGMNKLPSTVELNIHDFTREEIAEKRMNLLNENGQIDYFLSSGGGPLEIQYLNMLSAHSSYWTLPDFVRFIVLEVGRQEGREGTLPALRAEKKRIIRAGRIG